MRKPSATFIAVVVALVLVSAGTGVAASKYRITSSKQVKAGSITLSDLSKSARRALHGQRGQRGETGPQGPQGLAGTPGATGSRGPSDAWFISDDGPANGVTLPPGQYVLTGDVYLGSAASPQCTAWHATGGGGAAGKTSYATGAAGVWNVPVSDAFTMTQSGDAWIECTGVGAGVVRPDVSVIEVGTLH